MAGPLARTSESSVRRQVDEPEGVLKRQVPQLARSILRQPECSAFYRTAEADVGMCFRSHERMFPRLEKVRFGDDQ